MYKRQIYDRIATMSCKAAVKGNNELSFAEADKLIDELLKLENPYNCPHGRPTIVGLPCGQLYGFSSFNSSSMSLSASAKDSSLFPFTAALQDMVAIRS